MNAQLESIKKPSALTTIRKQWEAAGSHKPQPAEYKKLIADVEAARTKLAKVKQTIAAAEKAQDDAEKALVTAFGAGDFEYTVGGQTYVAACNEDRVYLKKSGKARESISAD